LLLEAVLYRNANNFCEPLCGNMHAGSGSNQPTSWSTVLLEKLVSHSASQETLNLSYKCRGSVSCSQEATIGTCPEPNESNAQLPRLFP